MNPVQREAAKIAAIYAVFGVLWILLSDQALLLFVKDPQTLTTLQTYKGQAYVALTALLLYGLTLGSLGRLREAEARALQLQKLEAMGRMAGGVAHDFNNVLTVVIGMTELAKAEAPRGGVQRGHLEQVMLASERGRDLVKNLMAYARRQPVALVRLDLAAAVEASLPLVQKLLKPTVEVQLDLQPAWVLADPSQLQQVLLNLAMNANDAMPQGGRLRVQSAVVGERALLRVSDTGHGMDEEVRRRVFEPFYSTKGENGTGLGLASVFGIVQQLGGSIEVESAPGRGATFVVGIPSSKGGSV